MLRVSSRQRLVSWDAFDAAAPEVSSSASSASREAGDGDTATCNKNTRTEPGMIPRTTTHQDSSEGITLPLQPPANDDAHNADDDFYSVAGYDSLPSTAACASNNNAGRRSSSSANDNLNAGWSFDHSDNDRGAPGSSSPSGGSRRKRDRADHSIRGAGSPRFSVGSTCSSTKKNVESLSALPHFPSLLEEDSIPLDLDKKEGADGVKSGRHKGMARTPSLLDLMAVKPSAASAVGAAPLPINTAEHLVPHTSTASTGQQKTLIIPRVPSKIGLGNRVASDLSLNSTLSRYMSVPSNLCAMSSGMGGGGAVALEENGADLGMTMSTSSSVAGTYSPSSQSQGVANLSMDAAEAEAEADKFLPGDALCTVASYLATSELRELSTTNADLRVHFAGPSGKHLWVDHATRRWPAILQPEDEEKSAEGLQGDDGGGNDNYVSIRANRFDDKVVEIVDRIGVATAGLGSEDTVGLSKSQSQQQPNLSALLGLAAKDCPTAMSPCPMPSASEVPGRQRRIRSGEEFTVVRVTDDSGSCRSAVQFTSRVGEGDRSITSDAPLPRPLQPPRAVDGGEGSGENGPSSDADGTNKSSSSSSNRWSPRLPSVPSPTQTLITLLRTASRVSGRGDDGEGGSNANGRPGRLRPFVCPYVASEDADRTVIDMTPRLVAYYEVKILPHDTIVKQSITQEDAQTAATLREGFSPSASTSNVVRNPHHHHRRGVSAQGPEMPPLLHLPSPALGAAVPGGAVPLPRNLPLPRHVAGGQHGMGEPGPGNGGNEGGNEESLDAECVAIGLSTSRFRPAAKMPGWDAHSFGYHSDDGGIFHGAGDMEREFGKTYGVGDTVGCGIDYSHGDGGGAIFFTLNGVFLGYAWTNVAAISLGEDMYPTVGVDSNCPLEINFGSHPFAFDLGSFVEGQRHCIEAALGPLAPSASRSKTAAEEEEEEAEESDDVMGRYLDQDVGAGLLYDSSKIDEWGCLEPSSAHGTSGSAKWNGMGGSAMRSTRTRNGGLRRPRMFRGQYA